MRVTNLYGLLIILFTANCSLAQQADTARSHKNIIRYNLSGALLFGVDHYIVLGYERVLSPKRSISVNFGKASLPKLVNINTDSFQVQNDKKRSGVNISIDYRFYLARENKFKAPHGLYIGPYYSYNRFTNEVDWSAKNNSSTTNISTSTKFNIHTVGFELGYQFIFWNRLALDLILVGPGLGFYNYKATIESNIDPAKREQIQEGLKQLLTQKFPGMNYVFSDEEINADGVMRTNTIGYRYIVQIGFNF
ncbi:DUF3575 domain-containing protein [Niastella yeongjuensis]|uniref:DUF3575 domain-containing protein n=1 Tax=Niastella yeongjuensis TaxID=354355 RepID=UPI0008AB9D6B|nr:DUF3575 domain-containing protein [Niastella yeongjuensis]SEP42330.1 hypothetical protein SAMN05660816_05982 [Niastella yeongjuensis]